MDKSEMLKYCKYYHGEDKNPYDDNDKGRFWFGEKMWTNKADTKEWEKIGKEIKSTLSGEKLASANKYNDITFGIIVFIEMLFSKHDPYDTMDWIYNY